MLLGQENDVRCILTPDSIRRTGFSSDEELFIQIMQEDGSIPR